MSWNVTAPLLETDELFGLSFDYQLEQPDSFADHELLQGDISDVTVNIQTTPHLSRHTGLTSRDSTDNCPLSFNIDNFNQLGGSSSSRLFESDIQSTLLKDSPTNAECSASSPVAGKSSRKEKNPRLSSHAVAVLQSWVSENQDYPYPTTQEKEALAQQSGLNKTQVSNWFSNTRRRKSVGSGKRNSHVGPVDALMSPLERWQNSPPEYEGANTSDIMRALAEAPYPDAITSQHASDEGWSSYSSSASFASKASSSGSFAHSHSGSDVLSGRPEQTYRPPTPLPGKSARRRRRKPERQIKRRSDRKTEEKRMYQCTFCSDTFLTKYDWQRHEKALHLPIDRWSCAPDGGLHDKDGIRICEFCGASGVDLDHLEIHNYLGCRERPPEDRTFARKDHLQQHLKSVHHTSFLPSMDRWRDSEFRLLSRCGFCETALESWKERVDHISDHFKKGADMIQWQGDWGFEPEVLCLVKNAMPPFLLGQERHTMDPWKMSEATGTQEDEHPALHMIVPNGLHRYMDLRRDLIAFLHAEFAVGVYPSDQQIQDKARQIAYGSNDPWDQTYADDPVWLAAIKQEARSNIGAEADLYDTLRGS